TSQVVGDEIVNRLPGGWHALLWAGRIDEVNARVHRERAGAAGTAHGDCYDRGAARGDADAARGPGAEGGDPGEAGGARERGGQTAWIVDLIRELGGKVHVVHPVKVKWIAESKKKTDRIDAQLLADLLRIDALPEPVHVPTPRGRELRALLVARRQLVRMRTRLINVVRGLLRQHRIGM